MSNWLDYSFARPDLSQVQKDAIGVLRYICPDSPSTHGKILFPAECDQILARGLDLALNFEWYEGRCNEGASAGSADGATALQMAKALGYPRGSCIYFSHDTGVYNWPNIDAYFRAVRTALGGYYRLGAYGSNALVGHLHTAGLIDKGWQTLAWSNGARDPWAVLYQDGKQLYNGAADNNQVTGSVAGWLGESAQSASASELTTSQDWFDMATQADLQKVVGDSISLLLYGDGPNVSDGSNTHPYNIKSLHDKVDAVKGTLGVIAYGDGRTVPPGSDTHPENLKVILSLVKAGFDPSAFAAAIVAALPAQAPSSTLSIADVETALRNVLLNGVANEG